MGTATAILSSDGPKTRDPERHSGRILYNPEPLSGRLLAARWEPDGSARMLEVDRSPLKRLLRTVGSLVRGGLTPTSVVLPSGSTRTRSPAQ